MGHGYAILVGMPLYSNTISICWNSIKVHIIGIIGVEVVDLVFGTKTCLEPKFFYIKNVLDSTVFRTKCCSLVQHFLTPYLGLKIYFDL